LTIDGDVLEIDSDMSITDVKELYLFVKDRLEYIEEIVILGQMEDWKTSSLFSLLVAIKKKKPSLKIPAVDEKFLDMGSFGKFYWKR
jgi:type IV secretory pathway ATPase VirB11/archaellum biosynthesis ATPase